MAAIGWNTISAQMVIATLEISLSRRGWWLPQLRSHHLGADGDCYVRDLTILAQMVIATIEISLSARRWWLLHLRIHIWVPKCVCCFQRFHYLGADGDCHDGDFTILAQMVTARLEVTLSARGWWLLRYWVAAFLNMNYRVPSSARVEQSGTIYMNCLQLKIYDNSW